MRYGLWGLVLLSLTALPLYAASGAWHASVSGPPLSNRGAWVKSKPLHAPPGVSGTVNLINWRYQLTGTAPSGLQVKLCGAQRCASLEGGSGATRELASLDANETLYMVFGVAGRGALPPGLQVLSSEVMVNYQN
ncbi:MULTISPECIES: flagellar protein FlhE [Pantoea]|uniref:flagellar protein FlhE n=1 Tax=Pantoea TaxID=53335 RepID=UPI000BB57F50|nr:MULTISPECIES: flagellar protein FlhE [Pantoea]PNK64484.1 flagellar protein FlhE [Pantoea sp. FDAARGOS_194]